MSIFGEWGSRVPSYLVSPTSPVPSLLDYVTLWLKGF